VRHARTLGISIKPRTRHGIIGLNAGRIP
jgi:hypothetical protein